MCDFNLATHGDPLERDNVDFIQSRLPAYEETWKRYIGNDGSSQLAPMQGVVEADETPRRLFAQYHYTILESILAMKEIAERNSAAGPVAPHAQGAIGQLRLSNDLMAFHAHMGRLRDLFDKAGALFGARHLAAPLDDLYTRRSNVLHESRLPVGTIEGVTILMLPQGREAAPRRWAGRTLWGYADAELEFVSDYLQESFEEVVNLSHGLLSELLNHVKDHLTNHRLVIAPPSVDLGPAPNASGEIIRGDY